MKLSTLVHVFVLMAGLVWMDTGVADETKVKVAHPPVSIDEDVWSFVHQLSVEQRIGQMLQLNIDSILVGNKTRTELSTINVTRLESLLTKYHVGSFLNSPVSTITVPGWSGPNAREWYEMISTIQEASVRINGIPTIYGIDSVHGANFVAEATLFPQQLNGAQTFNRELIEKQGGVTAKDTRAAGIPWTFAPILDIAVNPEWPRVFETFGECPFVAAEMGGAIIRGLQGVREDGMPDLSRSDKIAATFKHFIGYSNPRDGHDRVENWIPERELLEYFLPPFTAAIQQHHIATGMLSYTNLNGVPITTNSALTIQLLRDELGFNGTLVTDYNEIFNLQTWHRLTPTVKEAISLALRTSSLDMAMIDHDFDLFFKSMKELIDAGIIPVARINVGAAHVIQLKKDLGLITSFPMKSYSKEVSKEQDALIRSVGSQADRDLALDIAHESIVLLQNDGTLPVLLQKSSSNPTATSSGERLKNGSSIRKILVVGPTGDSIARLSGGWTIHWQGSRNDDEFAFGSSIYASVKAIVEPFSTVDEEIIVTYEPGVNIDGSYSDEMFSNALRAAEAADLVIACIGEEASAELPGDIDSLELPEGQQYLINQLTRLPKHADSERSGETIVPGTGTNQHNKKVVLVLVEGRPRILDQINLGRVRAVLHAGLPGPEGGQAIADIIFGLVNPSGKLAITYPSSSGDLPIQYYHKLSQATNYKPQWEFGSGLSYTNFEYSNIQLSTNAVDPSQTLDVSIDIKNTGAIEGKETVLCFLSDLYRIVSPEVKRLRGFEKIHLKPNESKTVTFTLGYDDWSFIGVGLDRRTEAGEFRIQIGSESVKFMLNESSDDYFDTEVIITRKMVKRWWKEIKQELKAEDALIASTSTTPNDTNSRVPLPLSSSTSKPDLSASDSLVSSSNSPDSGSPKKPSSSSALFFLGLGLVLICGIIVGGWWVKRKRAARNANGEEEGSCDRLIGGGSSTRSSTGGSSGSLGRPITELSLGQSKKKGEGGYQPIY